MVVLTHMNLTKTQFILSFAHILFTLHIYICLFIDCIWTVFPYEGLMLKSKTFEQLRIVLFYHCCKNINKLL